MWIVILNSRMCYGKVVILDDNSIRRKYIDTLIFLLKNVLIFYHEFSVSHWFPILCVSPALISERAPPGPRISGATTSRIRGSPSFVAFHGYTGLRVAAGHRLVSLSITGNPTDSDASTVCMSTLRFEEKKKEKKKRRGEEPGDELLFRHVRKLFAPGRHTKISGSVCNRKKRFGMSQKKKNKK